MSRLYVYALVDQRLPRLALHGHTIEAHAAGHGVYALAERRADPPSLSEAALREQHAIAIELARRATAILPARFGAFVDSAELSRIVALRHDQLRDALDVVRNREQMTVRLTGESGAHVAQPTGTAPRARGAGTTYLEQRRAAAGYPLPEAVARLNDALRTHVVAERAEPGTGPVRAIVYHLIARGGSESYRRDLSAAAGVARPFAVDVTGPWPPFAFAPELLG